MLFLEVIRSNSFLPCCKLLTVTSVPSEFVWEIDTFLSLPLEASWCFWLTCLTRLDGWLLGCHICSLEYILVWAGLTLELALKYSYASRNCELVILWNFFCINVIKTIMSSPKFVTSSKEGFLSCNLRARWMTFRCHFGKSRSGNW